METTCFERIEKKYMLAQQQYADLQARLTDYFAVDQFGNHAISNIYFDTPDYLLVRKSIDKPHYKEKLRLRCYGAPLADSRAFVELKKKVGGVVYKRRTQMELAEAMDYISGRTPARKPCQITHEIDWFLQCNPVEPRMLLAYDRVAMYGLTDPNLRVTFDTNIVWRDTDVELTHGIYGEQALEPGQVLMEIKIPGAMPLWLSHMLSELKIFPASYSKYGHCYVDSLAGNTVPGGACIA